MNEQDSITASQKHRKHSSVMVRMTDRSESDVGSILSYVSDYFCKSYFVEFISQARIMKKLNFALGKVPRVSQRVIVR